MLPRDSFQVRSVCQDQGHSPDKVRLEAGSFAGGGGRVSLLPNFLEKLPSHERL